MLFLFNMMQHHKVGQATLEDVVNIMGGQLRALGHDCMWDKANNSLLAKDHEMDYVLTSDDGTQRTVRVSADNPAYNVLVEGFTNDTMMDVVQEHYAKGARFIILATEEPTDKGFNHGIDPEMAKRQFAFHRVADYADAILHLVPGQDVTDWYGQFAPSAYAELGHATGLEKFGGPEPEFDFGFFGSLSPRRHNILHKKLSRYGSVHYVCNFPSPADRDREMRRCKVIVQLRKFEEMGLVSSSRCNTALHLGRPVIAEPHDLCKPWDEVVKFSRDERTFYADAAMAKGLWRGLHAAQFNKFKEKFTPEHCIGAPLRAIGILPSLAQEEKAA